MRFFEKLILLSLLVLAKGLAAQTLSVETFPVAIPANGEVSVFVADSPVSSGVNAHLFFPASVTVTEVLPGELLLSAGDFHIDSNTLGDGSVIFVVYSLSDVFESSGELLKVRFTTVGASPGYPNIGFVQNDIDPLVNSSAALASQTGDSSIEPNTANANILLFSLVSDQDDDGLPDAWEIDNGLDPLDPSGDNSGGGDPDGDGFTNQEELEAGTDPNDRNSNPESGGVGASNLLPVIKYIIEPIDTSDPGAAE